MKKICLRLLPAVLIVLILSVSPTVWAMPADRPYDGSNARSDDESAVPKVGAAPANAWKRINGVCYNGSGVAIPGAITRGIDVSEWERRIDWKKVKQSDVDFAFVRISHSTYHPDEYFEYNMKNAIANGIPVGVYIYSTATTEAEVLQEAFYAINAIKGYKISYPVVYDMEDNSQGNLTKEQRTDLVIAFCEEIKKAGYYPMLYTNLSWYTNYLDMSRLKAYDVWLASFSDRLNRPDTSAYRYSIWQATAGDEVPGMNTTRGLISGTTTNVDLSFGFVDYTKKIKPRTAPLSTYKPSYSGWIDQNGKRYYYKYGEKVKGIQTIGSNKYYFSSKDGSLVKKRLIYSEKNKTTIYCGSDGVLAKNKWVTYKGKKYYFGNNCYAYLGSRKVKGKFYWFDKNRGYMMTKAKLLTKDGTLYYYGSDGARVTSGLTTITENGKKYTYYFRKNGKAAKGWKTISGKTYYFYGGKSDNTGRRAENITLTIRGEECTFDKNGVLKKRTPVK